SEGNEYSLFIGLGIGALTGWALGNTAGVYLAGETRTETASLSATFTGCLIGTGAGFLLSSRVHEVWPVIPFPLLGALAGNNLTLERRLRNAVADSTNTQESARAISDSTGAFTSPE
ncbi:MAG: hypothetical protein ACYC9O_13745, partial [Candidatus Latescibacterota bacterium]